MYANEGVDCGSNTGDSKLSEEASLVSATDCKLCNSTKCYLDSDYVKNASSSSSPHQELSLYQGEALHVVLNELKMYEQKQLCNKMMLPVKVG